MIWITGNDIVCMDTSMHGMAFLKLACDLAPAMCSARYGPRFSKISATYLYSRIWYLGAGAGAAEAYVKIWHAGNVLRAMPIDRSV